MRRFAVAVGLALAALAPLTVSRAFALDGARGPDVTGSYHSNWDDVKLVQDGTRVHGTYVCCGGGTIEGKIIEGRTLRYTWRSGGGWGLGVWTIGADRLDGTWGSAQHESNGGRWDLVRVKPSARIAN